MPVITKQSIAEIKQYPLFTEIKTLIEESKQQIAVEINSTITMLYWQIGSKIKTDILKNKRAEYGQETIKQLSIALTTQYGKGWSEKHLRHCLRFAEVFTNAKIVSAVWRQLSWTHIKAIMYFDDLYIANTFLCVFAILASLRENLPKISFYIIGVNSRNPRTRFLFPYSWYNKGGLNA